MSIDTPNRDYVLRSGDLRCFDDEWKASIQRPPASLEEYPGEPSMYRLSLCCSLLWYRQAASAQTSRMRTHVAVVVSASGTGMAVPMPIRSGFGTSLEAIRSAT